MDRLTKYELCLQIEVYFKKYTNIFILTYFQSAYHRVKCVYWVNIDNRDVLNSVFPALFQVVLTLNPGWPDARDNAESILLGFF